MCLSAVVIQVVPEHSPSLVKVLSLEPRQDEETPPAIVHGLVHLEDVVVRPLEDAESDTAVPHAVVLAKLVAR
jgi:hypothetical protein